MSSFEALWLGIVQGLTEFFPVSSSGHLALFEAVLGVEPQGGLLFEVAVHVATLVAIVLFYRRRIGAIVLGVLQWDAAALRYVGKLALGTLPAVGLALAARSAIEAQFRSPTVVACLLLVTGVIVWTTRFTAPTATREEPSWGAALAIGVAQAFAILPGISRSGATVAAALAAGVAPRPAAEFSFLLGVVAIAGASVLMLPELGQASPDLLRAVSVGSVAALASGILAISLFVRMLQTGTFRWFALWAWAMGAGYLAWSALGPAAAP